MRVLVIGLGTIARKHLQALKELQPEAEVFALRSRLNSPVTPGVTNLYDLSQAATLKPSFVLLTNPTNLHEPILRQVLPWGVPVFIEKPVLTTPDTAPALLAQIREKPVLTYVGCNLRFLEGLEFVKKWLSAEGRRVLEVNVYCGSYLPDWRPGQDYRKFYSARPEMGGGAHLDLIHEIDYVYWLFGPPRSVDRLLRSASDIDIEAVDYANYRLVYPGFVVNVTLNYYRRDYRRTLEVLTTNTTITLDLATNELRDDQGEILFSSDQRITDTYLKQMTHFLTLLQTGAPAENDLATGVAVLRLTTG